MANKKRMTHRDELGLLLNNLGLCGEGAEIGVYLGEYSHRLLSTWQGRKLHLIDPWTSLENYQDGLSATDQENELRFAETLNRLEEFIDRFQIHRELSLNAAREFREGELDFVYIDANHSYEYIRADLEVWFPKVKSGGLFAGHDFIDTVDGNGVFGVQSAVEEFAEQHHLPFFLTHEQFPSWYFFVP